MHLQPEIDRHIRQVLEHGQFILGPEVAALESALADRTGARHCIAVSSGTDALLMALMAWGIGPGDAVFLPAFTFTATAEVVALLRAEPVFVDVDEASFNIDPQDLSRQVRRVLSEGRCRPRVVVPVDLFGLPADYPSIGALAAEHDILILADAAQSFGGRQGDKAVGVLGDMTATSFFPAKPLGCYGDGGAMFTDNPDWAALLKSLRVHGSGATKYEIARVGINGRLDTLQAAILLAKLPTFSQEIDARNQVADWYDARLKGHVTLPPRQAGSVSAWAQYTIRVPNRSKVQAALQAQGIPTAVYYPQPIHLQAAYRVYGHGPGSLPVSERISDEVLSVPMHPYLSEEQVGAICTALLDVVTR